MSIFSFRANISNDKVSVALQDMGALSKNYEIEVLEDVISITHEDFEMVIERFIPLKTFLDKISALFPHNWQLEGYKIKYGHLSIGYGNYRLLRMPNAYSNSIERRRSKNR